MRIETTLLLVLVLNAPSCQSEEDGLMIYEPCRSSDQCALGNAICEDRGGGVKRCVAYCSDDSECGKQARCLALEGDPVGACYRKCDSSQDCGDVDLVCADAVKGSSQRYCFLESEIRTATCSKVANCGCDALHYCDKGTCKKCTAQDCARFCCENKFGVNCSTDQKTYCALECGVDGRIDLWCPAIECDENGYPKE